MSGVHLDRYRAAVERVRLLALIAVERGLATPRADRIDALSKNLAEMEHVLRSTTSGARDAALARALGLGDDEVELLWTIVAASADPRLVPHLVVLAGGGEARRGVSCAIHAQITRLPPERAMALGLAIGAGHPLVRHHLIVAADDVTSAARAWVAPARVARHLAGDDAIDPELITAGTRVRPPPDALIDDATAEAHGQLARALADDVLVVIDGQPGVGRRTAVGIAAATLGRGAVALDVTRLAPGAVALDRALAALIREAVLTNAVPIVAGVEELTGAEGAGDPLVRAVARALDGLPGAAAATTTMHGIDLPAIKQGLRISIPVPQTAARRALWDRQLARGGDGVPAADRDTLAMRYRLGAGGVERAVHAARLFATGRGAALTTADLVTGVRNNIAERMGGLATRVHVNQEWSELVLGKDTLDHVRALASRVEHSHRVLEGWGLKKKLARGTGVAALFSGPPGTGKTMVAGLIARQLDLELYQVDLSKVVSKWVGETEKQLSKIFDAADAGHALLLFDEADALFAKRTEVKAAIDRYANLEVNYLLQRVEAFGGITILTTNMDASIDPALIRRLSAHVRFWPPDHDERALLWRQMLTTASVPLAKDIDFVQLAGRFSEMTGANIRNAAIAGAFLAAAEGDVVAMRHLERAARGEYASMGRQLSGQSR